jgi:hypothetical protein
MLGLVGVLEGAKAGKLSIISAPPHPWKVEDWGKWSMDSSSLCLSDELTTGSGGAQDAILDSSEKALLEFADPPTVDIAKKLSECDCPKELKLGPTDRARAKPLDGRALEQAVDNRVFDDLRQMLFMPVLHTEYRRFVVLRSTQAIPPDRDYKDSVRNCNMK